MGRPHEDSSIRKQRLRAAAASASSSKVTIDLDEEPPVVEPTIQGSSSPFNRRGDFTERNPGDTDVLITPPATLTAQEMRTPEEGQTYKHKPNMPEGMIPKVGMPFESEEAAYEFFLAYAEKTGFPIKWYRTKTTKRDIACSMGGHWSFAKPPEERVRNKFTKKTGCKVNMKLKDVENSEGEYSGNVVVETVCLDHNHPLAATPRVVKQMRCHKRKDKEVMKYVDHLHGSDVPPQCVRSLVREMYGSQHIVPMTSRDLKNRKAETTRDRNSDDINKMISFFKYCEEQNPQFFWAFECDDDGIIQNLFWSHASMQGEYADFGDAVTFDTTYKTNMYNMPLAMFVGSNHHHQNTIFGVALLRQETIKSFQWLFGAFKSCMQGANKLRCILTDEDQAMAEAIKLEFPGVIHRLCRWHVTNKVQPQLNDLAAVHKGFNEKFSSAINHPLTPNEFELAWKDLLDEFGLHNDPTLRTLYRNRMDWVKAFFKKDYCGRMTSTQRSESVNMMVKNEGLDRKTSLHMFPKLMLQFIQRRSEKEAAEAYGDMSIQETGAQWSFVEQAARLYTRNVFMQFNKTVSAATRYHIVPDPDHGEHHYLVQHTNRTSKITWGQHEFKITVDPDNEVYECECRSMEHTGLFCEHIIRGFMRANVDRIPAKYFLKRLTKFARKELPFDRHDEKLQGEDGETQRYRHTNLMLDAMAVVRAGTMSSAGYKRALFVLKELRGQISKLPADIGINNTNKQASASNRRVAEGDNFIADATDDTQEPPYGASRGASMGGVPQQAVGRSDISEAPAAGEPAMIRRRQAHNTDTISSMPPPRSKVKGDRNAPSETRTLGAQGPKLCTRNCSLCGLATGHNRASCPENPKNAERIEMLNQPKRKRGRPRALEKMLDAQSSAKLFRSLDSEFSAASDQRSAPSTSSFNDGDEEEYLSGSE
ncbi:unnamed protein product [Urochloa decumbens]|uniref:Protein FAR1-RELATED SEQUENCE n=1 Tax=Urochloa decumbens TaxID=240449 RepID=A0ABC9BFF5_9POAL